MTVAASSREKGSRRRRRRLRGVAAEKGLGGGGGGAVEVAGGQRHGETVGDVVVRGVASGVEVIRPARGGAKRAVGALSGGDDVGKGR